MRQGSGAMRYNLNVDAAAGAAAAASTTLHAATFAKASDARAWRVLLATAAAQTAVFALHAMLVNGTPRIWKASVTALLQALVSVRVFIIFHDTVHCSFFASPRANRRLGAVLSCWAITPWQEWRDMHIRHHAISGNLGEFDQADTIQVRIEYSITNLMRAHALSGTHVSAAISSPPSPDRHCHCLCRFTSSSAATVIAPATDTAQRRGQFTAAQYYALPWRWRAFVRVLREPVLFFPAVALLQWWLLYPISALRTGNLPVLLGHAIHLAVARASGSAHILGLFGAALLGTGLFHLQHAANPCYRARPATHSALHASLHGSTHLRVPWALRWATLGIEYHHLHHLETRVPCYALAECHRAAPPGAWAEVTVVGYWAALRAMRNVMYDETSRRVVPFGRPAVVPSGGVAPQPPATEGRGSAAASGSPAREAQALRSPKGGPGEELGERDKGGRARGGGRRRSGGWSEEEARRPSPRGQRRPQRCP